MDDLDDLAAAAEAAKQRVPVRRREAPATPGRVNEQPQVVYVYPHAPPPPPPTRTSPFAAGFFGTFGVVAAFATMILMVVIVVIALVAWSAARTAAERQRVQQAAEAAEATRAAAMSRAQVETRRYIVQPNPSAAAAREFLDSVVLNVTAVDAEHLRVEGTNVTDRTFSKVNILIWGTDREQALASAFIVTLPAKEKFERTIQVENLTRRLGGRQPRIQVEQK